MRMVKGIREIEASIGNGQKRVYESEKPIRDKLRF
jgi:sialic acid synthase SpsE